ncbi:hypothetical protein [Rhodococcus qingshengii]|uniref:hypothetical protein n=1 Tax=Rhodococcus qingshengii TaxID=334542 RepID=UPI0030CD2C88
MNLRSALADTPKFVRVLFSVLIILGIAVAITGLIADHTGFWGRHSFLLNLTTSLVGFCIGVPIALVVLSAISSQREQKAEVRKVQALTESAWTEFDEGLRAYCLPEITAAISDNLTDVFSTYTRITDQILDYAGGSGIGSSLRVAGGNPAEFAALRDEVRLAAKQLQAMINAIRFSLPMKRDIQLRWSHVRARWRVLDTTVQTRRREFNLPWLDAQTNAIFEDLLSSDTHPLSSLEFQCQPSSSIDQISPIRTIADAPLLLDALAQLDEAKLIGIASSSTLSPFRIGYSGIDEFTEIGFNARGVMNELLMAADRVDIHKFVIRTS